MTKDLLHSDEVKDLVRRAYRSIDGDTSAVAYALYDAGQLEGVPNEALERALGVGNHLRFASLSSGDVVLDVGCGDGIDTILATRRVGPTGRVIALDFLPEMLEHTAAAARAAGLDNVDVLEGEMEAIPLPDDSVDHVVSNGAINLSPRKARVLAEIARVLRPGGGFCVSDLTIDRTLCLRRC